MEENMQNVQQGKERRLCLKARRELSVEGVREVVSFDENGAVVVTEDGELTVEGTGVKISNLDAAGGEIEITGKIDAIIYSEEPSEKKKGIKARLFG